jgi:hypothetical protein
MGTYDKIQSSVLACAVVALGASICVSAIETDFKQYAIPLALVGSFFGFSSVGLGLYFSSLREKKLHQNIGRAIRKFADEIDKPKTKSN